MQSNFVHEVTQKRTLIREGLHAKKIYDDDTDTDQDVDQFRRSFSRQRTARFSTSEDEAAEQADVK